MQLPTILSITFVALASLAQADLHFNAICTNRVGKNDEYNAAATEQACTWYRHRNTGNKQWDQCPDCTMITQGIPHCQSNGKHMGGDEITYYCQKAGAANALTS